MKRRWSGLQAVRVTPEESSSEVTSSSTALVMSPANSLASTDIGDVDLEFWDLDLNAQNHARGLTIIQNGYGIPGHTIIATSNHHLAKSDTSSMSGKQLSDSEKTLTNGSKGISPEQEELIHRLVYFQNEYEHPSEEDVKRIIVFVAERPALIEGWKVEKIQEIYLEALRAYVDNRRKPKPGTIFAKLLSVLTELRTLGNQNSEMCFSLKLKNKKLPPFLAEIWDVDLKT
ncbi:ecdysone receptor [Asbolus verrucosus]|uniref:Ecdysone receptor n=1 Tax=Asbolus verrucosus TaxID=1661398 RepID=A0A482VR05_ASBVE|nr:ecdysone receptor [Asbolus verrucosus]